MFSVVIPLYNKEKTIVRAINSVLKQTYQIFEIIVINDGSTDNGKSLVNSIEDNRIKLISQKNKGVSSARNKGIELAEHKFITFLDADDEWYDTFLSTMINLIEEYPKVSVYASSYIIQNTVSRRNAIINGLAKGYKGIVKNYFKLASISDPPVWTGAVCVKKNALKCIKGFPEGIKAGEDLLTWAKLIAKYNLVYINIPLAIFYQDTEDLYYPKRIPPKNDIVGEELKKLESQIPSFIFSDFNEYCAAWHKMRCSSFLKIGMRKRARIEAIKSLQRQIGIKYILYYIFSFFPRRLLKNIKFWRIIHK